MSAQFAAAQSMYNKRSRKINEGCHNVAQFNLLSQAAKSEVKLDFENNCRLKTAKRIDPKITAELEAFMNDLPQFKLVHEGILEISAPSLKVGSELSLLEKICKENEEIREVRWTALIEVILDRDLSGGFWAGKNLVICTRKLTIVGQERIIDVSGQNGVSASKLVPPPPNGTGLAGQNGQDGTAGEDGGNVAIIATVISNASNLHIVSNGGSGGDGQPGGNGSKGKQGIDGDQRFKMSLTELKKKFPSPAKIESNLKTKNLDKGYNSLKELAGGNAGEIKTQKVCNKNCRSWVLEAEEGAHIQYGYFQGAFGSSFYVFSQGAPGTNAQHGGIGGLGGRCGVGGKPGNIYINTDSEESSEVIVCTQKEGTSGVSGQNGVKGESGTTNGKQGTDYALVDPYAGWSLADGYGLKEFSGNLKMKVGREQEDGSRKPFKECAYCPLEERYVSFLPSTMERAVLEIYGDPDQPEGQPMIKQTNSNKSIDADELLVQLASMKRS